MAFSPRELSPTTFTLDLNLEPLPDPASSSDETLPELSALEQAQHQIEISCSICIGTGVTPADPESPYCTCIFGQKQMAQESEMRGSQQASSSGMHSSKSLYARQSSTIAHPPGLEIPPFREGISMLDYFESAEDDDLPGPQAQARQNRKADNQKNSRHANCQFFQMDGDDEFHDADEDTERQEYGKEKSQQHLRGVQTFSSSAQPAPRVERSGVAASNLDEAEPSTRDRGRASGSIGSAAAQAKTRDKTGSNRVAQSRHRTRNPPPKWGLLRICMWQPVPNCG